MHFSKWEMVLMGLVVVGAAVSVKDYRDWKRIETAGFGLGPTSNQTFAESLKLDGRYQNVLVRLRLSYPSSWKVSENPATADPKYPPKITDRVQIVRIFSGNDADFSVTAERNTQNLVDAVDEAASKVSLAREREYISTTKTNVTVLTWITGLNTHQAAYLKVGDVMFTMFATSPTLVWSTYAKTFWQMYSSFVPL